MKARSILAILVVVAVGAMIALVAAVLIDIWYRRRIGSQD